MNTAAFFDIAPPVTAPPQTQQALSKSEQELLDIRIKRQQEFIQEYLNPSALSPTMLTNSTALGILGCCGSQAGLSDMPRGINVLRTDDPDFIPCELDSAYRDTVTTHKIDLPDGTFLHVQRYLRDSYLPTTGEVLPAIQQPNEMGINSVYLANAVSFFQGKFHKVTVYDTFKPLKGMVEGNPKEQLLEALRKLGWFCVVEKRDSGISDGISYDNWQVSLGLDTLLEDLIEPLSFHNRNYNNSTDHGVNYLTFRVLKFKDV